MNASSERAPAPAFDWAKAVGWRWAAVPPPRRLGAPGGSGRPPRDVVAAARIGRPRKNAAPDSDDPGGDPDAPKRRGRPKKGEEAAIAEETTARIESARAAAAAAAAAASAPPPAARWPDAAAAGASEDEPRRFGFHRRLQAAAQQGDAHDAEGVLSDMADAGMPPGPRAWHVLVIAHLKAGDVDGALDASVRADEAGVSLLLETWCALVYGLMSGERPDVEGAREIVATVESAGADATGVRCVLLTQLSARGLHSDAAVEGAALRAEGRFAAPPPREEEGLGRGSLQDAALAFVESLCALGRQSEALELYGDLFNSGRLSSPARPLAALVRASAAAGDIGGAQRLLDEARRDGVELDAPCFNGLLAGLVRFMGPEGEAAAADEGAAVNGGSVLGTPLEEQFAQVTDQMVRAGARPDEGTLLALLEGHCKLGALDAALGALKGLRDVGGVNTCQRIPTRVLASFLRQLAAGDRPVDLLAALTAMGEDFCAVPAEAMEPDEAGRTLLTRWLPGHMATLAARAAAAEAADALSGTRLVDGVAIAIGDCAVDDAGAPLLLSKMTARELRAEAEARGLGSGPSPLDVEGAKRSELVAALKAARAALPFAVQSRMKALEAARKRARAAARDGKARESAKGLRRVRIETWREGRMVEVTEKMVRPPRAKFMKAG
ncbi:hypothetical protein Rsub_00061 [Raphidocelis subcapitata]|uniref:Pentacotripeptide-repeat region of PRORP domain-containing protein n=1 Tax=Raphidocelis subcapitata TaxID=307507 RepID=A0A2V0NPC1_9CHLO|nr:hypothetical protein Rsub_00061 [Raphidocelis subcapitata]|eukprot:GBF87350.1 hypothetical protein Rsub_00061 [Raphidocelis subcapitata]